MKTKERNLKMSNKGGVPGWTDMQQIVDTGSSSRITICRDRVIMLRLDCLILCNGASITIKC